MESARDPVQKEVHAPILAIPTTVIVLKMIKHWMTPYPLMILQLKNSCDVEVSFLPRRDLNNFIRRFFLLFIPFLGDYIC
jgi:hypothetical protein